MQNSVNKKMSQWGTLAFNFLNSSESLAQLIIDNENKRYLIKDVSENSSETISIEELEKEIRFSDHNLVQPLIYNFYHAIELLLKAPLISKSVEIEFNHDLNELIVKFREVFSNETHLIDIFERNICMKSMEENSPVKLFFEKNSIDASMYFESLRYPERKNGIAFIHFYLMSNEEKGMKYFSTMINDIHNMKKYYFNMAKNN